MSLEWNNFPASQFGLNRSPACESAKFRPFDQMLGGIQVAIGTVKWFNATKGFGFIAPETGGKDVFVHISAVEKAGMSDLREGAKISYEIVQSRGRESAENLRVE